MSIHWYPGHMHKAQKDMIEILDARIPSSSENPAIAKLRWEKPC
jgi:ribosome biogenesis GTPase A